MPDTSLDVDPVFEPVTLETASPATIANQAPHVDFVRREVVTETSTKSGGTGDERLHDLNNMRAWRAGALGTSLRFANWNREARGPASPDVSFVAMRPPDCGGSQRTGRDVRRPSRSLPTWSTNETRPGRGLLATARSLERVCGMSPLRAGGCGCRRRLARAISLGQRHLAFHAIAHVRRVR